MIQATLLPLRYTCAAGLMQVRGAKRKFGGIKVDPLTDRRKKNRMAEFKKYQKKPLISEERLRREIDLPYLVTSLSMRKRGREKRKGGREEGVREKRKGGRERV